MVLVRKFVPKKKGGENWKKKKKGQNYLDGVTMRGCPPL